MAGSRALSYAENDLGVHAVYEEAQRLATEASELRQHIANMRRMKAAWETAYLDKEYEYASDARAAHSNLSQTAWDKKLKELIHKDPELRKMRSELAEETLKIERCEADLSTLKVRIEIATSRMVELGGYLGYLAATKQADTYNRQLNTTAAPAWPGVSAV